MTGEGKVKLLGNMASPLALRIKWALKLKGIEYEYREEDLRNKSPLLLQSNPVHKKIPVLIHNGKPIAESLVILEYIDEVWKQNPLPPEDPNERARARFWANFADEKCVPALINTFSKLGEEQEKCAKEARENLKSLESGLNGRCFFGVNKIGLTDVAVAWIGIWGRMVEDILNIKLNDEKTMPVLTAWFKHVLEDPILKECVPPYQTLLEHSRRFQKTLLDAAST